MGVDVWASEGEGEEKKTKTKTVGGSVWAGGGLGWIATTLGGLIFFFCSPEKLPKVGNGWWWVAASRQVVLYLVA